MVRLLWCVASHIPTHKGRQKMIHRIVKVIVSVECDGCGDEVTPANAAVVGYGWAISSTGRDYCPECVKCMELGTGVSA
jgi:hypothetical protein